MSLYVIRSFVQMREQIMANTVILKRLAEIDKTLMQHDQALWDIYQKLLPLLQPPEEKPVKRRLGFHADQQKSFHPGMAHEVASAIALRQHHIQSSGSQRIWDDANKAAYLLQLLAEYLVMSHHGRVRKVLRDEIPRNPSSSKEPESVRGIQEGQELETINVCSHTLPTTKLSVDCRKMGRDANGHESYTKGVLRLLDHYGPFRLAYLEMLLRAADCRASKEGDMP